MRKVQGLRSAVLATVLATTVIGCGTAFAEELQEFSLDAMVVTATRTEAKAVDVPVNTTVVSAEKIEERHYQNVAEALKDVPGAQVIDSGMGSYEKAIVLNGDTRVLVLVDGRRVNFDIGGTNGRNSYDINQLPDVSVIDHIEVVKGHGGALYGSDAVGGVVNIITKKMDHSYGKVSMGFGSNQARDAKAMYSIKEGKTGVMVAASKYKQGYMKYKDALDHNTKRKTGYAGGTNFENEKVSLKVAQKLSDTTNLEIAYDYSKLSGNNPEAYPAEFPEVDKKTNNFSIKYDWMANGNDQGYLQVYRNKYDYITNSTIEETDTGFEAQQAVTLSDNNKLVVGASYRSAKASNDGRNGAASYNGKVNNKALFVSDQWEFIPTWTLDAGVRYDNHSKAGSKTTWSAGLNKKFDENSHAYFNWGQVFKAPSVDDLYYYSDMGYYGKYFGDPNLKPEKGDSWTLGYGTKIADRTEIDISYFQSDLKDAIDWKKVGNDRYASNIAKQKKNGMELSVNHELNDNWDLEASYSYVRVRNDNNDGKGYVRDVNYTPNVYRFGVRYHNDLWNADLFMRAGYGADTNRVNTGSYSPSYVDSSYVTLDASLSYKATKALSFYAKGYNLLNKAYAEHAGAYNGSYTYPAQGRRFIVGAEYTF